jgi:hypothetical protein
LLQILGIIWASPYTLIGLFLGGIGLRTGGRARIRGCVIEFYGGAVTALVRRLPHGQFTLALAPRSSVRRGALRSFTCNDPVELTIANLLQIAFGETGPATNVRTSRATQHRKAEIGWAISQ